MSSRVPSPLRLPGPALLPRGLDTLVHVDVTADPPVHIAAPGLVRRPGVVRGGVTLLLLDNLREGETLMGATVNLTVTMTQYDMPFITLQSSKGTLEHSSS